MKHPTLAALLLIGTVAVLSPYLAVIGVAAPFQAAAADEAGDEDGDGPARQRLRIVDGRAAVVLTPAERRLAGIESRRVDIESVVPETRALAKVLDTTPLLAAVDRTRALREELEVQRAIEQDLRRRQEDLGEGVGSYAERTRITADYREAVRQRLQLEAQLAEQHHGLRGAYGVELAKTVAAEAPIVGALRDGAEVLIRLVMPVDAVLPDQTSFVYVAEHGERRLARKAYRLGRIPNQSGVTLTPHYLLRAPRGRLEAGMVLHAFIPQPDRAIEGMRLPLSAEVWHAGGSWVYAEVQENAFVRLPLGRTLRSGDHLIVEGGLSAGERVVVTGAQLLLAEEFRAGIPEEDDD